MTDSLELLGSAICVLDLETARSADDCKHCGTAEDKHCEHFYTGQALACPGDWEIQLGITIPHYEKIGWDNKSALGLSIGCWWDYRDGRMHWFDGHTLEETVGGFVETQPLLVSFNGISFDFVLMRDLLRQHAERIRLNDVPSGHEAWTLDHAADRAGILGNLCDAFKVLCASSYDILAEIWKADPERKFEPGLNSLDVISQANGFGAKAMTGAIAPRLWQQGRYAEVIDYCQGDVSKTKALFEQIVETGMVLRGDNAPIVLPRPALDTRCTLA